MRTQPIVVGWLLSAPHQQKAFGWTHPFVVVSKATDRGSRVAMLRGSRAARRVRCGRLKELGKKEEKNERKKKRKGKKKEGKNKKIREKKRKRKPPLHF